MGIIAIGVAALVVLVIVLKVMKIVMSGCMKLIVLGVLVAACAAAWYYFGHRLALH